jgi:hypothetical protein
VVRRGRVRRDEERDREGRVFFLLPVKKKAMEFDLK